MTKCDHEFVPLEEAGCIPYEIYKLPRNQWCNWVACKKCHLIIPVKELKSK